MKKLLAFAVVVASFVACNDGGSAEAEKTAADTTATQPTVDTTATQPTVDTTAHAADTTKKDTVIKK